MYTTFFSTIIFNALSIIQISYPKEIHLLLDLEDNPCKWIVSSAMQIGRNCYHVDNESVCSKIIKSQNIVQKMTFISCIQHNLRSPVSSLMKDIFDRKWIIGKRSLWWKMQIKYQMLYLTIDKKIIDGFSVDEISMKWFKAIFIDAI